MKTRSKTKFEENIDAIDNKAIADDGLLFPAYPEADIFFGYPTENVKLFKKISELRYTNPGCAPDFKWVSSCQSGYSIRLDSKSPTFGALYILNKCPFCQNPAKEHESYIFQYLDGSAVFFCLDESCLGGSLYSLEEVADWAENHRGTAEATQDSDTGGGIDATPADGNDQSKLINENDEIFCLIRGSEGMTGTGSLVPIPLKVFAEGMSDTLLPKIAGLLKDIYPNRQQQKQKKYLGSADIDPRWAAFLGDVFSVVGGNEFEVGKVSEMLQDGWMVGTDCLPHCLTGLEGHSFRTSLGSRMRSLEGMVFATCHGSLMLERRPGNSHTKAARWLLRLTGEGRNDDGVEDFS
jgi:hypothetical protein